MADIRTLLHEAAPRPTAPLDMAAVRARAKRRSLGRLLVWVAGLGAAVGVGVPVGAGLLVSADDRDRVGIVEPAPVISTTSTTAPAAPTTVLPGGGGEAAGTDAGAAPGGGAGTQAAPASPAAVAAMAGSDADHPPAPWCSVESLGLAEGERRSCHFTATAAGGWNIYEPQPPAPLADDVPIVRVTVRRDGVSRTYRTERVFESGPTRGSRIVGCADDIIRPGDVVDVVMTQASRIWMDLRTEMGAGAGTGWGCRDPGP